MHHEYDCSTGVVTTTALTDEELNERDRIAAEAAEQAAAEQAELAELRAAAESHPDPLVQALARKAGLL